MRTRRIAAALLLAVLTGCQPGARPPPTTAAPQATALPGPGRAPQYDTAVLPVDETRTPEKVAPKAVISKATAEQAAERAKRQAEAERKEKAEAEKEKAAAAKRASAASAEPPTPAPASVLSLPQGSGSLPLPKPIRETRKPEAYRPGINAAMPPPMERPELPKVAAAEPAKAAPAKPAPEKAVVVKPAARTAAKAPEAAAAPPPAAEPAPQAETAAAASPSPPPPAPPAVEQAQPKVAAAPSVPVPRQPPSGPPLGTVGFDPRSAELSDGMRAALAFFARDANAHGVRQVELWASSSDDDPVYARKVALARALAVHAYLTDVGLKARVDIGGYIEGHGTGADRVDLMVPKR